MGVEGVIAMLPYPVCASMGRTKLSCGGREDLELLVSAPLPLMHDST